MKPYYQDDLATIYHGDCLPLMPFEECVSLVTDPPYGISYRSGRAKTVVTMRAEADRAGQRVCVYGDRGDSTIEGDESTNIRDAVLGLWGDRPAIIFGSMRAPFPEGWKQVLVWDKGRAAGMGNLKIPWKPNWDPIFICGRWPGGRSRESGVLRSHNISSVARGRLHPHMKPVGLMTQLLRGVPDGTVVDPFMGSGSTLVAAKSMGIQCVGVELDERYCEMAASRLAQEPLLL